MSDKLDKPATPSPAQGPETPHQPVNHWKDNARNYAVYIAIALVGLILLYTYVLPKDTVNQKINFTQAVQDIKNNKVKTANVDGNSIRLDYQNGDKKTTQKEDGAPLSAQLKNFNVDPNNVEITPKPDSSLGFWANLLVNLLPIALIAGLFFFLMRQSRNASGSLFAFGRSKAKLFTQDKPKVKFKDVAGVDEAKQELEEIIEFLKTPEKFQKLGAKIPKGVLLVGLPGTGKTLLARAIAGEAAVPFFSIAGSEFMEMLVGVGASRVRDLFETAKKASPAIIFIDEIDAIGRQRGAGLGGGHDEREQTLNQLLVEMDYLQIILKEQ